MLFYQFFYVFLELIDYKCFINAKSTVFRVDFKLYKQNIESKGEGINTYIASS